MFLQHVFVMLQPEADITISLASPQWCTADILLNAFSILVSLQCGLHGWIVLDVQSHMGSWYRGHRISLQAIHRLLHLLRLPPSASVRQEREKPSMDVSTDSSS